MAFGTGLPPYKYLLDQLGLTLRGCYEHVVQEPQPDCLQPLIERLLERE